MCWDCSSPLPPALDRADPRGTAEPRFTPGCRDAGSALLTSFSSLRWGDKGLGRHTLSGCHV